MRLSPTERSKESSGLTPSNGATASLRRIVPLEQRRPVCSGRQAVLPGRFVVYNSICLFHRRRYLFWLSQDHPLVLDTFELHGANPIWRCFQRRENWLMSESSQVILGKILFRIAHGWSTNIDIDEYIDMLQRVYQRITFKRVYDVRNESQSDFLPQI